MVAASEPNVRSQPTDTPTNTNVVKIPYNTTSLTLTVLPWPAGIVFPPAPLSATSTTEGSKTITASGYGKFNGEDIHVFENNWSVLIGEKIHVLSAEGTPVTTAVQSNSVGASTTTAVPTTPTPTITVVTSGEASVTNTAASVLTTSTNQSSPTAVPSQPDKGLSKGAAAGIAIGCLLAGALIAGFLAWFCFARSKKRRPTTDQEGSALAFLPREKATAVVNAQSVGSSNPGSHGLENGLPQPLEDKAITSEISKLETTIKNHVQSFYHNGRVSPSLLDLNDLQALGNSLPISTGTLSTLLGNSDTREIALRFVIAWAIISRIEPASDPDFMFLPPEVAKCFQLVARPDGVSRVHSLFLVNWRRITAELLQPTYSQNSFFASDSRSYSISAALSALDVILQPYADPRMDNNQRRRNLEEILKRAASFAFTLFAQPSSWTFDWKEEQGVKSGCLCIFPALLQVSDETGEAVKPPREFSGAVVRNLDG